MLERCKIGGNYIFREDMDYVMMEATFRADKMRRMLAEDVDRKRYESWCIRPHERI